ncbi:hypothetical protein E2562_028244 [Oryza meyeriana var. granulata]|uniref:Uncharacterized protein n=1 Tax=Oryza meyeriana var. granulata TaxID=110450 RepID=A0A6G1DPC9_9ORYZ|nr:hypothetical protein E2562_028244 [Oryza meyeriana var. granulata]
MSSHDNGGEHSFSVHISTDYQESLRYAEPIEHMVFDEMPTPTQTNVSSSRAGAIRRACLGRGECRGVETGKAAARSAPAGRAVRSRGGDEEAPAPRRRPAEKR